LNAGDSTTTQSDHIVHWATGHQLQRLSCPALPSRPTLCSGRPSRAITRARFSLRRRTTNWDQATSVGGFLGIGDRKVAVPFEQLTVHEDDVMLTQPITKEEPKQMPAYEDGTWRSLKNN